MAKRTSGGTNRTSRGRHARETQQDGKTIKEKRPARFAHTSRHTDSDQDQTSPGSEDTQTWTYQGGTSRTTRIGKSFHRVFGHTDRDDAEGEQK